MIPSKIHTIFDALPCTTIINNHHNFLRATHLTSLQAYALFLLESSFELLAFSFQALPGLSFQVLPLSQHLLDLFSSCDSYKTSIFRNLDVHLLAPKIAIGFICIYYFKRIFSSPTYEVIYLIQILSINLFFLQNKYATIKKQPDLRSKNIQLP